MENLPQNDNENKNILQVQNSMLNPSCINVNKQVDKVGKSVENLENCVDTLANDAIKHLERETSIKKNFGSNGGSHEMLKDKILGEIEFAVENTWIALKENEDLIEIHAEENKHEINNDFEKNIEEGKNELKRREESQNNQRMECDFKKQERISDQDKTKDKKRKLNEPMKDEIEEDMRIEVKRDESNKFGVFDKDKVQRKIDEPEVEKDENGCKLKMKTEVFESNECRMKKKFEQEKGEGQAFEKRNLLKGSSEKGNIHKKKGNNFKDESFKIVRGSFHQGDVTMFIIGSAGRQCTANAAVAIVMCSIKIPIRGLRDRYRESGMF